ncbi:hypothetical protein ACLK2F_03515 [Escherichia coli]
MDFSGKNVWVTGAGKGIGYATALVFVERSEKSQVLIKRSLRSNIPLRPK